MDIKDFVSSVSSKPVSSGLSYLAFINGTEFQVDSSNHSISAASIDGDMSLLGAYRIIVTGEVVEIVIKGDVSVVTGESGLLLHIKDDVCITNNLQLLEAQDAPKNHWLYFAAGGLAGSLLSRRRSNENN